MGKEYKLNDMVFSDEHGLGRIVEEGDKVKIVFIDDTTEEWDANRFPYEILDDLPDNEEIEDDSFIAPIPHFSPRSYEDDYEMEAIEVKDIIDISMILTKIERDLDEFDLTIPSRKVMLDFFKFKLTNQGKIKRDVRFNLLIQGQDTDRNELLIEYIINKLKKLSLTPKKSRKITEFNAFKVDGGNDVELLKDFQDLGLIAIHDCEGIDKDSVKIVSSGIRADIQRNRRDKARNWDLVKRLSDLDKNVTFIVAGDNKFVEYLKENDEFYYRLFANHITFRNITSEDIITKLYQRLKDEKLKTSTEFDMGIKRYINVVYPKADLKGNAFIDDLMNRILVNYYIICDGNIITEECVPFYKKPRPIDEIMSQLDNLIGLNGLKKEFRKLYKMSLDKDSKFKQRLNFAFIGNPGTGKTTVGNLTAELLSSMGLLSKNKLVVVTPTDVISVYKGESAQLMQEKINEALGGVLFIDEAYFLTSSTSDANSPEKKCLEVLLQEMEKNRGNFAVVFAGYEDEIKKLMNSNPGLDSRVPFKIHFDDYTDEELTDIFNKLAAEEGFVVADDADNVLKNRIAIAKTEDNFGNARTIANIYQQLKSIWSETERTQRIFTADDINATMPIVLSTDLRDMIGLKNVKEKLSLFESRVKYLKFLSEKQLRVPKPNMHMMFTGNPGTGKTTVARKIADCLYHIGILKTNKLVVVERKDLVAEHIGGTAAKTNACIQKAMNGVLFIDEAYSLYRDGDNKDYGREAIEALITAMEEYKGNFIVIMAGYKNEMNDFFKANPGIFSRIGFTFHFDDYTPDELLEMFINKITSYGFTIDKSSKLKVKKVMKYFSAMENFGNGRFVDKLIDMTISNRSLRKYSSRYNDICSKDVPEIKDLIENTSSVYKLTTDEDRSDGLTRRVAIHEAGHAIVLKALCPEQKIDVLTINSDATSLGCLKVTQENDQVTESLLKAMLAIKFGGRNAERIVFGEHSVGCTADMSSAKALANKMINEYAMGELGVTTTIDLLKEADCIATEVLLKNKVKLEHIAQILCEKGTVTGKAFVDISQ